MNLPKDESNTFELKVCYTKEDVYILWKKIYAKKENAVKLTRLCFSKKCKELETELT